jgi:hypothetical protein
MDGAIPEGSVAYIRYMDHVLYKNTPKAVKEAAERETVGWLTHENDKFLCVENDRTIDELPYSSGSGSGLVLLKSCILEIRALPLQKNSGWSLISRNTNFRDAESALQTKKRKIQPK